MIFFLIINKIVTPFKELTSTQNKKNQNQNDFADDKLTNIPVDVSRLRMLSELLTTVLRIPVFTKNPDERLRRR